MKLLFKYKFAFAALFVLFVFIGAKFIKQGGQSNNDTSFKATSSVRQKPMKFNYKEKVKEPEIKNISMIGEAGHHGVSNDAIGFGKLIRALRFEPIAKAVEERYGIPKHTILAMVIQESGGGAAILNGANDGGAGLSHMQPFIASQFGLKTLDKNRKMVDKAHGRKLRAIFDQNAGNWATLAKHDDRFHPICNLDAVGRMLAEYSEKPVAGKSLSPLERGLLRYAGKVNYAKYSKMIASSRTNLLDSENVRRGAEKAFNMQNPNLMVNGKKAGFREYMEACQSTLANWGLDEYEDLPAIEKTNRLAKR